MISSLLLNSSLPPYVKHYSLLALSHLAHAESATHGASLETVHFHEVGAIDSIVDVIGTVAALFHLKVTTFTTSPLPLTNGTVFTDHGILPVPAPATLRMLAGMATTPAPRTAVGEIITPTGAALLRALLWNSEEEKVTLENMGVPPKGFVMEGVGVGCGKKEFEHANIVRAMVGRISIGAGGQDHTGQRKQEPSSPKREGASPEREGASPSKASPSKGSPSRSSQPGPSQPGWAEEYEELRVERRHLEEVEEARREGEERGRREGEERRRRGGEGQQKQKQQQKQQTYPKVPNVSSSPPSARKVAGSVPDLWTYTSLTQLDCNLDDMTGECTAHVLETLLSAGALDSWITPIIMKKGRPASCLSVLCEKEDADKMMEVVFRHATTLGIRTSTVQRASLRRSFVRNVPTGFTSEDCAGTVSVKMAWLGQDCVNLKPEFEDCRHVSERTGAPVKVIMDAAKAKCLGMAKEEREREEEHGK